MSEFEKAMDDYFDHFHASYPFARGIGYPGKTPEDNIRIIRDCIARNKPVKFEPRYRDDCDY